MIETKYVVAVGTFCLILGPILTRLFFVVVSRANGNGNGKKAAVDFARLETTVSMGFTEAEKSRGHIREDIKDLKENMVTKEMCEMIRQKKD